MNRHSELMLKLSEASDRQIDAVITSELKALAGLDVIASAQIKDILDRCAYGALCSDFVMRVLDVVWHQILDEEAKNV